MKTKGLSLCGFVCMAKRTTNAPRSSIQISQQRMSAFSPNGVANGRRGARWNPALVPAASICAFLLFTVSSVAPVEAALTNITSRGFVTATSCYTLQGTTRCDPQYAPDRAIDGTTNTSWFSDGTRNGDTEVFYWQYGPFSNTLIARIEIDPSSFVGYGFHNVSERVLDRDGNLIRQYNWIFSDYVIRLDHNYPHNTFGRTIELVFTSHQSDDRGGFSELRVFTDSVPESFTLRNDPPFCAPHSLNGPSVDLRWSVSSGADRYDIFRNGSIRFQNVRTTAIRDTELIEGSTYSYRVVASNASSTATNASNEIAVPVPTGLCVPNVVFVDCSYFGTDSDGSLLHPFRAISAAYQAAMNGDTLRLFSCNYPETLTLSKPLRLEAANGIVNIGR